MEKKAFISLRDLAVGYNKKSPVLQSLNLIIRQRDFLGIIGPNGCGKTTLLRTILGIVRPLKGRLDYHPDREAVCFGYVPQTGALDPVFPLTVFEIVMMARYKKIGLFRKPKENDRDIVWEALKHCNIEKLKDTLYRKMSGGQRQKTLIARALAGEPNMLVLDEPTHNMDLPGEQATLSLLKELNEKRQLTVIMVSHLLGALANFAGQLLIIENGVFLCGDTEAVLTEENLSRLYGMKVGVKEFLNQKFIFARR